MQELIKDLIKYEMAGVGDILLPRLIAEIGDVKCFHSEKALITYAEIDAPPYQLVK